MKVQEVRLLNTPNNSFIFHHEKKQSHPWHYHPEYELVLIIKGAGIRMVGNHIERFKEEDLVFLGSNLPHEWKYDNDFYTDSQKFTGEAIVLHFLPNSFGEHFFDLPENHRLKTLFINSSQGCQIYGKTKTQITSLMHQMLTMNNTERLYTLFSIFKCLLFTDKYNLLTTPSFLKSFKETKNKSIQKALEYILQNFQNPIKASQLLEITNMSNTAFYVSFKKIFGMTWKRYLLELRIGYCCRLLIENSMSISEIAYMSGFENISNFNRQFKTLKSCTPKEFILQSNQR